MRHADALTAMVSSARTVDLPDLAANLGRALGAVMARAALSSIPIGANAEQARVTAALLTVDEAAERLGVPASWLYRHAKSLPFSRKLGHRTLRFDATALEKWAANRGRR